MIVNKALSPARVVVLTKYRFIGDTLLAVPLLRAVKKTWPGASVTLLSGGLACELLEGCPYLDGTIEYDPYRPQDAGWGRFLQIVAEVRRGRYDLALVCNRSFHSALLVWMGGVGSRVGWAGFQGRDWMLTGRVPYGYDDPEQKSYLDLLDPVFPGHCTDTGLELWVSEQERERVAQRIPAGFSPLIGMQPGASHAEKQWPAAKYAALIESLRALYPSAGFVLLGGPTERACSAEVMQQLSMAARARAIDLVGSLSLRESLACLQSMRLLVAGDTAIRHAAVALGTPSIALFGPTSLTKWGNSFVSSHQTLRAETGLVADILVDTVSERVLAALRLAERDQACAGSTI